MRDLIVLPRNPQVLPWARPYSLQHSIIGAERKLDWQERAEAEKAKQKELRRKRYLGKAWLYLALPWSGEAL